MEEKKPIVIIGGGGHAKVVLDALLACGETVLGFVDADLAKTHLLGIESLGADDTLTTFSPRDVQLANGVGAVGVPTIRLDLYESFKQLGYQFSSFIHPSAVVANDVVLGEGVQIMAGSIVQPGTVIGDNTIVNTRASVDHDCELGAHVHVAPGAILSGNVYVGEKTHIGAGATVIQGRRIGSQSVVGAGAVVIRDVPAQSTVLGVPARQQIGSS